jgi:predicted GNAT family N-acyltransferase
MNFLIREEAFGSLLQVQSVGLRFDVLRKPLGLSFSAEELASEKQEIHIIASDDNLVCGCLLLRPVNQTTIKMRQVAVHERLQGRGIGKAMVTFAEKKCIELGFKTMELHARKEAVKFYLDQNYSIQGDEFTEVGIAHFAMAKEL